MYIALKWGAHSALQLSAEKALQLADLLGFDVDHTSRRSIDSLYAEQPDTLLKLTYGECLSLFYERVRTVADRTGSYAVLVGDKEDVKRGSYSSCLQALG